VDLARFDTLEQQAVEIKQELDRHQATLDSYTARDKEHSESLALIQKDLDRKLAIKSKLKGKQKEWSQMKHELDVKAARLKDKKESLGEQLVGKSEAELRRELDVLKREGKQSVT
jgi:uncharacterized phage infection (PIP) family protein YhgE